MRNMKDIFIGWDEIDGSSVTQEEIDAAFVRTKRRAEQMEMASLRRGKRMWRVVAAVSAAAAAVALGVFAGMRISVPETSPGQFEVVADCGQRSDVLLPDGKSCSGAGFVPDRQVSEADMLDLAALVSVVEDALK